jgi:hypothetical protein
MRHISANQWRVQYRDNERGVTVQEDFGNDKDKAEDFCRKMNGILLKKWDKEDEDK